VKIILIGRSGCGKTTLIQKLENRQLSYQKTQMVEYSDLCIDTPGEYLENHNYYRALLMSAVDADKIGLVEDCLSNEICFQPAFAGVFAKDVVGIVTKIDSAPSRQAVDDAIERLQMAGVTEIFTVSALTGEGVSELQNYTAKK
jgi:ethanolamine utilization protein EutP